MQVRGLSLILVFIQQVLDCKFQLHAPHRPLGSDAGSWAEHMAQQASGEGQGCGSGFEVLLASRSLPIRSVRGTMTH